MAAVIDLRTGHAVPHEAHRPVPPARPRLTVIEGGRAPRALEQRRVYRQRRLAVALAAVVLLATVGWAVRTVAAPSAPQRVELHTVQPGDTLWGLAATVAPGADRRDVVDRIIELNSASAVASDGVLRVGETLRLPVAG